MGQYERKENWVVSIQEIFEGCFYVAASSPEKARRLAWAHFQRGNEPRGVGDRPGYLVEVHGKVDSEDIEVEGGVDVDETDPGYEAVGEVPEVF